MHISLSDAEGKTVGGHLIDGTIFTTCEIVLGTANNVQFSRIMDDSTGYNELEVRQLSQKCKSYYLIVVPAALMLLTAGFVAGRKRAT